MREAIKYSIAVMFFCLVAITTMFAQQDETLAIRKDKGAFNETLETERTLEKEAIPYYYRNHRKLPLLYNGYAIELTTSDLPLRKDYGLFEKFGSIFIDQLEEGGLSYVIKGFKSKKSCISYMENIVIHNAPEARVVRYKDGKRTVITK